MRRRTFVAALGASAGFIGAVADNPVIAAAYKVFSDEMRQLDVSSVDLQAPAVMLRRDLLVATEGRQHARLGRFDCADRLRTSLSGRSVSARRLLRRLARTCRTCKRCALEISYSLIGMNFQMQRIL